MDEETREQTAPQPDWKPLTRYQRRVAGVLVEKAKTTPDAYPLTLNALTNGCNQKSNRSPQMSLTAEDVEEAAIELRRMGAIMEVQGSSRVPKYRHGLYEWLGVDKTEMAVMAELLLRGEQTTGELRGRAARMEKIADLASLKPIVNGLIERGLVLSLTPEGRGQIVTHNLYQPEELDKVRERAAATASEMAAGEESRPKARASGSSEKILELESQIRSLQEVVASLRQRIEKLEGTAATE